MKKLLLLSLFLGACATTVPEQDNGIVRLTSEPKNCEYLYNVDTTMTSYNVKDAYDFLEKRIIEQDGLGDTYYITGEETQENEGAIFGPKNTFKVKAKVYKCKK